MSKAIATSGLTKRYKDMADAGQMTDCFEDSDLLYSIYKYIRGIGHDHKNPH